MGINIYETCNELNLGLDLNMRKIDFDCLIHKCIWDDLVIFKHKQNRRRVICIRAYLANKNMIFSTTLQYKIMIYISRYIFFKLTLIFERSLTPSCHYSSYLQFLYIFDVERCLLCFRNTAMSLY